VKLNYKNYKSKSIQISSGDASRVLSTKRLIYVYCYINIHKNYRPIKYYIPQCQVKLNYKNFKSLSIHISSGDASRVLSITRHPSPVTRHPSPATRHPPPVEKCCRSSSTLACSSYVSENDLFDFVLPLLVAAALVTVYQNSCFLCIHYWTISFAQYVFSAEVFV